MMNFIIAWVLVTTNITYYGYPIITYSPPMADIESCQFLQKILYESPSLSSKTQCVQIKIPK